MSSGTTFAAVAAGIAGMLALLVLAGTAAAAPSCAERVLLDWSDNGRVDQLYRLSCYEEALDDLPPDIRDYTEAADVIERALQTAGRSDPALAEAQPAGAFQPSRGGLVLGLVGASVALVAAAVIGYLARSAGSGSTGTRR